MSIQTEINRLNNAKANILSSIQNKGVDTSSVETLDDVSALIDNISVQDTTIEDRLVDGTLAGNYTNNRITEVNYGVFYGNNYLTGFDAQNVISVGGYSFYNCSELTTLNLPSLKTAGGYSFYGIAVENVYFPELTTIGNYTFGNTSKIKTITLPKLTTAPGSGFRQNTGCTRVDLGAVTSIEAQAFFNMYALVDVIIRTPTLCTLANTNAFNGCSRLANIYVPDDLVESYKIASNWSTHATKIKGLSELVE